MNGTFMFGHDNFGHEEDFSKHYHAIGGKFNAKRINNIIRSAYSDLDKIYPDEHYRHHFPSLKSTIKKYLNSKIDNHEITKIIDTFSFHEIGYIPDEYREVLHHLNKKYLLAIVIDIWAPKSTWINLFNGLDINKLFSASSFSSDHGMVKPSPKPFERVIKELGLPKDRCLMIGDSIRRDLGGAIAVGVDCVLVGGAKHPDAVGCYENLIELSHNL